MSPDHDGDFAGVETDQIACRVNAGELDEPPNQVLVELLAVVALQHDEDAIGGKRLLVHALRAHGVVHVRDADEHRGDVELRP